MYWTKKYLFAFFLKEKNSRELSWLFSIDVMYKRKKREITRKSILFTFWLWRSSINNFIHIRGQGFCANSKYILVHAWCVTFLLISTWNFFELFYLIWLNMTYKCYPTLIILNFVILFTCYLLRYNITHIRKCV